MFPMPPPIFTASAVMILPTLEERLFRTTLHSLFRPALKPKRAEVNPGAASHLLVYLELRGAAFVIDGVKGIVRAVWQGLVRDVYGVLSGRSGFRESIRRCLRFLS